ncbi:MAG TPA: hypothetical protein GXX40_05045 [Firmicutes bacterium]|nr:hypothetical protein [Bacillota bacterium]
MVPASQAVSVARGGGYSSCLVSGGCDRFGRVPLAEHEALLRHLWSMGLRVNVHTGKLDSEAQRRTEDILRLVSCVSLELDGSEAASQTLEYLIELSSDGSGPAVVPHVLLRGEDGWLEERVFPVLEDSRLEALVVLVLKPQPGEAPPPIGKVVDTMKMIRKAFPQIQLCLGCMRPGGEYRRELDAEAVNMGFNRIAMPHPYTARLAERAGLRVEQSDECCVLGVVK